LSGFSIYWDVMYVVCTAITVYKKITNHDYVATCEGDKYRVNVSEDGRVNVTPHKPTE